MSPLHTHPEAHLLQPEGQQEQQLFLQDVHWQFVHLQDVPQLQVPVLEHSQGSISVFKRNTRWEFCNC
ncbi:hypothetical protein, partial [Vibrio vulnificus]|uniref:hypothetical protein n=1 Tax=Vibrio vulnificus TaxID=672 RepID=UPI001CCE15F5